MQFPGPTLKGWTTARFVVEGEDGSDVTSGSQRSGTKDLSSWKFNFDQYAED